MKNGYACPSKGCRRSYMILADLFQHMTSPRGGHKFRERFIVVDLEESRLYLTDRTGIRIGELQGIEKEEPQAELTVAAS